MPGVFVAAVLILSASLTFLSQYPGFKERATADEPNILAGSEFLHEIYQANMVLYKQICDWKAEGKEMTAQDFFLSGKIKKAELEDYNEYYSFDESPLSFAGEQIDELLYQWDLSFHNGLEQQIDYEIMDRESGRTFANTERALHYLGTEEESIYLDNTEQALELIKGLHSLGIKVSMDDFGSGYSSLNLLSKLPIDIIKLDRVFLKEGEMQESDRIIISCVVDMAKKLKITSLCEGVETQEQSNYLKEVGCQMQQGFYFSRPIPQAVFENLIKEQ